MTAGRRLRLDVLVVEARVAPLDVLLREARRREGSAARRWPTDVIAKGTRLYHGTSARTRFEPDVPEGPAWFSTSRDVAERFVDWQGRAKDRRLLVYEVVARIPKLARVRSSGDMETLMERLVPWEPPESVEEMRDAMSRQDEFEGWFIHDNYGYGEPDILLIRPGSYLRHVETMGVGPRR